MRGTRSSFCMDKVMLDKDKSLSMGLVARPNLLKVKLLGVAQKMRMDSFTHSSISIFGRSLNSKMQSLNSDSKRRFFSCNKMANATHNGKDSFPNNNLSH